MDMIIHSYGYGQTIFNTLNALAMIRQTNLYPAMITTITLLVGMFYSWQMAASRVDGEWRRYIMKVAGMLVLINALLLPQTSMNVKDHVEKQFWRVDHIPLAFALPVGMIEEIGHLITVAFEQAFLTIGGRSSFSYYEYGMVFGARLAKEVAQIKVRNPEYVYNMRNFIDRCVMNRARIGVPFTLPELYGSEDLWALIRAKPGTFTRFAAIKKGVMQSPAPTCAEGVVYFETMLQEVGNMDIARMALKFKSSGDRSGYNNTGYAPLTANLKRNIQLLYGLSDEGKVDSVLKHNMLMNAMNEYRAGLYPAVKAQLQQEAGGLLSGDLAETVLTSSLAVMKNIAYASFIFLVPLILVAGGMAKYKNWIVICLSLQLWPALYAVLNMMIDYAYDPVKVISYSAWATETQRFDSMASVAANLTMLIPFLAIWLTKLGEGGFMQLAGSIMATANSATSAASAEKASGSRSWDNDSIGNSSRNNVSENKFDDSRQYVSGTNSSIQEDGSIQKTLPNNKMIITGGAGNTSTSGDVAFTSQEGITANLEKGLSDQKVLADSDTRSYSNSLTSTETKAANYLSSIAAHTREGKNFNIDTSTEEGKAVKHALDTVESKSNGNEKAWQQNMNAYVSGSISGGGKVAGFGANMETGTRAEVQNSSSKSESHEQRKSESNSTEETKHNLVRALRSDSFAQELGLDKSLSKDFRKSIEQTERLENQLVARHETIENYNDAINYTKTHGATVSKNMTQEVLEAHEKASDKFTPEAFKDLENRTPEVMKTFYKLTQNEADKILHKVNQGKAHLSQPEATKRLDNFSQEHKGGIKPDIVTPINEAAYNDGLNAQEISKVIPNTGVKLKKEFNRKYADD